MWVRGLKPQLCEIVVYITHVAPRVGAWIETDTHGEAVLGRRVAPRVGAWIETERFVSLSFNNFESHPVWVRGLKQGSCTRKSRSIKSHPVWVRGLKQPL